MSCFRQLLVALASDAQLRRICGWKEAWQVPHESTFSRAFDEFARMASTVRSRSPKARQVFSKHKEMLRTSDAIRLGAQPSETFVSGLPRSHLSLIFLSSSS
jgi:hypothetical protein